VIGTGSSGIQMIPIIAEQAGHLFVFQRTANFSVPAENRPITPELDRSHKEKYRYWRDEARRTPFGIAGHPPPTRSALEMQPEERERVYQEKWGTGGNISFLYAYNDLLVNKESNETAAQFVRNKIRSIVRDPKVAELLMPRDHPIGPSGSAWTMDTSRRSTATTSRSSMSDPIRLPKSHRQACEHGRARSSSTISPSRPVSMP
jgi:cyclohexanone monooxygenase